jgi:hypothetical protein
LQVMARPSARDWQIKARMVVITAPWEPLHESPYF